MNCRPCGAVVKSTPDKGLYFVLHFSPYSLDAVMQVSCRLHHTSATVTTHSFTELSNHGLQLDVKQKHENMAAGNDRPTNQGLFIKSSVNEQNLMHTEYSLYLSSRDLFL